MSGLGVIGAASAIVGLIQAASTVVDYVQSVKHAPQEAQEFRGHAQTLQFTLNDVLQKAKKLSAEPINDGRWNNELEKLNPVFTSLRLAFDAFSKNIQDHLGWRERLRWGHQKEKAQEIISQINSLQICLQTALTSDVLQFTTAITHTLDEFSGQIRRLNFQMHRLSLNLEDIQENGNAVRGCTISEGQKHLIESLAPEKDALWNKDGFIFGCWHEGSGSWLLSVMQYQSWRDSKGAGLWCYGAAGAGKTVLSAIIIENLVNHDPETPVLKIYFDRYNKSRPQTREACMASLSHEIASRRAFTKYEITWLENTHVKQRLPVSYNKWKDLLSSEMKRYPQLFVVVDALDEFDVLYQLRFIEDIRNLLRSINALVTSRDTIGEEDVLLLLHPEVLRIEAHRVDLLNYVDTRISENLKLSRLTVRNPTLRDHIGEKIIGISGQMFLLAQLLMDDIAAHPTPKAVEEVLAHPPETLWQAYDLSIKRVVEGPDSETGMEVLCTLCITKTSLTLAQIECLVNIRPPDISLDPDDFIDKQTILSSCAGLLIVDQQSNVVRFAHETTQAYLQDVHSARIEGAKPLFIRKCFTYLRFPHNSIVFWSENPRIARLIRDYPLLEYMAIHWGDHVRELNSTRQESKDPNAFEEIDDEIMEFFTMDENLACAVRVFLFKTSSEFIRLHQWRAWEQNRRLKAS